jgi:hypothetical protein
MHPIRKHMIVVAVALLLEAGVYAITVTFPANKGIVILVPLILPGTILQFFVGGGMSMLDGLAPEWRTNLALVFGFLLNTILMYGCCLLVLKMARIIRQIPQSR